MELRIVNRSGKFRPPRLVEPPASGYLHLAAAVEPPAGRIPRPGNSPSKEALLGTLKAAAGDLNGATAVKRASVYRGLTVPPPVGFARQAGHPARYDVVMLVETESQDDIEEVRGSPTYKDVLGLLEDTSADVHTMAARCRKCIGDVDRSRQGLFLFNYFVGADPEVSYELWDHLAGWFTAETGLDNSLLLEPLGEADYLFVNHARWDLAAPALAVRQFTKPSFYRYVLSNLRVNRTGAMPLLYHLA
ncbi:hypothetical protein OG607_15980 [Streptomyces sp. NBC_01537]|uniref:hypothetical protein n=1 Tax=Streptomyces sp. NBC_01537 TaxID=2903896 RepID=UPI003863AF72